MHELSDDDSRMNIYRRVAQPLRQMSYFLILFAKCLGEPFPPIPALLYDFVYVIARAKFPTRPIKYALSVVRNCK